MHIAIHSSPSLIHQLEYAEYFRQGFERHGLKSEITHSPTTQADIHVIQGPHFAKAHWLHHPRVILLDRAYYHQEIHSEPRMMDWVSVGWMNSDGERDFYEGEGRKPPIIQEPTGNKSIFLVDYNGICDEPTDLIRYHPANQTYKTTLEDDLSQCNWATGYKTTALITAALMGLKTKSKYRYHILNNKNWLKLLPYIDFHYREIASGELWDHLQLSQNQF
jgi:hypothetical protein